LAHCICRGSEIYSRLFSTLEPSLYGEKGGWGRFGEAMAIFANFVIGLGYGSGHQRESACGTMPFRVVGWFQYYGMKTQATLHVASQFSFL